MRVEFNVVLFEVDVQLIGAKDFANLDKLVVIVVAMEEGLFAEDLDEGGTTSVTASSYSCLLVDSPYWQTCSPSSRGPTSSRILESRPTVLDP